MYKLNSNKQLTVNLESLVWIANLKDLFYFILHCFIFGPNRYKRWKIIDMDRGVDRDLKNSTEKSNSKIFQCEICFKKFFRPQYLLDHIDGAHAKKFKCEECGRFFSRKAIRDRHVTENICKIEIVPFFIRGKFRILTLVTIV